MVFADVVFILFGEICHHSGGKCAEIFLSLWELLNALVCLFVCLSFCKQYVPKRISCPQYIVPVLHFDTNATSTSKCYVQALVARYEISHNKIAISHHIIKW